MAVCDKCGACCRTFPVFASKADGEREPRILEYTRKVEPWLATSRQTYRLHPLPFLESCAFLSEDRLCTIYDTRPAVCRSFEPGCAQCREARGCMGAEPLFE